MTLNAQRVRQSMTTNLLTITPETPVMRAIALFVEHDISVLPVVSADQELLGIVTERDCIRTALQAGYFDEAGGSVREIMSRDVRTVHPEDSLMSVGELFAASPFRRCPVVENGRLVGLISRRDVLRALSEGTWFKPEPGGRPAS